MTDLINHPGYWLRDDAAQAFARMEAARGRPFSISDAGRTEAQQQALIDRWDAGGPFNRPPFLYEPAMPADEGPHVVGGGFAVDVNNAADRAWIKANGGRFGWRFNLSWDTVHMIYEPQNDQTTGSAAALSATPTQGDDDMANLADDTPGSDGKIQRDKVAQAARDYVYAGLLSDAPGDQGKDVRDKLGKAAADYTIAELQPQLDAIKAKLGI